MASPTFELQILTQTRPVYTGRVTSLVAPGSLGYLGILANHAPLVTTLGPGKVTYRDASGATGALQSLGEGLLEVHHNKAVLLLDQVSE